MLRYYLQILNRTGAGDQNDASRYFDSFGTDSTPQSLTLAGFKKKKITPCQGTVPLTELKNKAIYGYKTTEESYGII